MKLQQKVLDYKTQLKQSVIERDEIVDDAVAALINKEHVMFLGLPGTAKSMISEFLSYGLDYTGSDGSKPYFSVQLNGMTEFKKVFGVQNIKKYLDDGVDLVITDNFLPNSRIGHIDEITRAGKSISDSLLKIINERKFEQNGINIPVPLETCFCTTNFKYSSTHFEALQDRILFWHNVEDVSDDGFDDLCEGEFDGSGITIKFTEEEIKQIRDEIKAVKLTKDTIQTLKSIKIVLRDEKKLRISDRKVLKIRKILRYTAWLAGRTETRPIDCRQIINCIWNDPEHKPIVREVVLKLVVPEEEVIDKLFTEASTMVDNYKEQPSLFPISDVLTKLHEVITKFEEMESSVSHENSAYLQSQLKRVRAIQTTLAHKHHAVLSGRASQ